MRFTLSSFVLFLLLGCVSEIDIDLPPHESRFAVGGLFCANDTLQVYVGLSKPSNAPNHRYSVTPLVLTWTDDSVVDTLVSKGDGEWFTSTKKVASPGQKFFLKVSGVDAPTVYAQSDLPFPIPFLLAGYVPKAGVDEDGDTYSAISIVFDEPVEMGNYYEIMVQEITHWGAERLYLWSNDIVIVEDGHNNRIRDNLFFTDKLINGRGVKLSFNFYGASDGEGEALLSVHLRHTTADYYMYKTKALVHYEYEYPAIWDGSGNPVAMFSNIEGGYGIFAGFGQSTQKMQLQ